MGHKIRNSKTMMISEWGMTQESCILEGQPKKCVAKGKGSRGRRGQLNTVKTI